MSMSTHTDYRQSYSRYEENFNNSLKEVLRELNITENVRVEIDFIECKIESLIGSDEECSESCNRLITLMKDLDGLLEKLLNEKEQKKKGSETEDSEKEDIRRKELRSLIDNVRKAYEDCNKCSGAALIYGEYDCESKMIVLYPKCLLAEPCLDTFYLTARILETLAHELIHAGQFQNWASIGDIPITVHLKCNSQEHRVATSFPYRYRPHEAEAFDKMAKVANILRRTRAGTSLERTTRNIVEFIIEPYRQIFQR